MATFVVSSLPCAKASGVAVSVAPASAAVPARKLLRCMLVVSEALAILLLRFYLQVAAGVVRACAAFMCRSHGSHGAHVSHAALTQLVAHATLRCGLHHNLATAGLHPYVHPVRGRASAFRRASPRASA